MAIRFALLAFLFCCSTSYAEEIPLDQIWALDMPDTRDVKELEPDAFGQQVRSLPTEEQVDLQKKSLIGQIRAQLKWVDGEKPKRGFAVSGTGLQALQAARDVFTGERKAPNVLLSTDEITAVFSSRQSGSHIRIYEVEHRGNTIEIRYRFEPHDDAYSTFHFALIPLVKLRSGMYQVKLVRGAMDEKYLDAGFKPMSVEFVEKIICGPFKFSVN